MGDRHMKQRKKYSRQEELNVKYWCEKYTILTQFHLKDIGNSQCVVMCPTLGKSFATESHFLLPPTQYAVTYKKPNAMCVNRMRF
jgi:transcription elongation factor Elf1